MTAVACLLDLLIVNLYLFFDIYDLYMQLVGGADSYQALCRCCYARAVEAQAAANAAGAAAAAAISPAPSSM